MKRFLMTVAAAALIAPASLAADDHKKSMEKTEQAASDADKLNKTQTKRVDANAETSDKMMAKIEAGSFSAKEFLGEGVRGVDGDRIARIDDVVIGQNGRADRVILLSGGVFGLGGERAVVDFTQVDLTMEEDYEPRVRIGLSEETIKNVSKYEVNKQNDYSLASEVLGSQVTLAGAGDDAREFVVNDIIMGSDGAVRHLIIQESPFGAFGTGEKYAVAFNDLSVAQGDGGFVLDMTANEIAQAPRYESLQANLRQTGENIEEGAEDAWNDTKAGADKAWDKTKRAGETVARETDEAMDDVGDEMEEAGDDIEEATDDQ